MSSLPESDFLPILKRLNAAIGYLNLKMPMDAWNELEDIDAKDRSRPEVLKVRVEVCRALEKWEMMAEVCRHLNQSEPANAGHPLNRAYAVRRFKDPDAAAQILEEAQGRFPQEATIAYNLACYRALTGNLAEAKTLLAKAFGLDESLRATALDDPDLVAVWDSF